MTAWLRCRSPKRWPARILAGALVGLAGCSTLEGPGYYAQSVQGHLTLMQAARPVDDWLHTPDTPRPLRERLQRSQAVRDYAVQALGLPDNPSYRRYADLGRDAVVWNVVAAPVDSLTLHRWCFPVTGCVSYRGYFDRTDAQTYARQMQAQGWEVAVLPVPAYSTLGWLNWAGGDPLLNTFIHWPDAELARLIFHELAHQVVYVPGDTDFNESFATAVERLGLAQWAHDQGRPDLAPTVQIRREAWRHLLRDTREALSAIYESNKAKPLSHNEFIAIKNKAMKQFRQGYQTLRNQWGGSELAWAQLDAWVAGANNASLGAQASYDRWVPAFEVLFAQHRGDWAAFYDAVRRLASQDRQTRETQLTTLTRP